MCEKKTDSPCMHPDIRKAEGGKCSPEQIRKCHGTEIEHPCEAERRDDEG
jgi:hypothetical protein